jgi:hypothetical protein
VTGGTQHFIVDWKNATGRKRFSTRIPAGSPVTIDVNHFNFLRYTVQFDIQEDSIGSYRALERLWSQVFLIGGTLASGNRTEPTPVEKALIAWHRRLEDVDAGLTEIRDAFPEPGLTDEQVKAVCEKGQLANAWKLEIEGLRKTASDLLAGGNWNEYQIYRSIIQDHNSVMERLRLFATAATRTVTGAQKVITTRNAGTVVTVTLTAKDESGSLRGSPIALEYFVRSRLPLAFHTGMAYSGLRDIDFEKVRALEGEDLWTQTRNSNNSYDLIAFLSMEAFARRPVIFGTPTEIGILPTLGTGVSKPGDKLFVGLSLQVWRFFLSGGGVSGNVATGEHPIVDEIGNQLGTRELFDAVTNRRQWGWYGSISLNVLP